MRSMAAGPSGHLCQRRRPERGQDVLLQDEAALRLRARLAAHRDMLFQISCRKLGHGRPGRLRRHRRGNGILARLDAGKTRSDLSIISTGGPPR